MCIETIKKWFCDTPIENEDVPKPDVIESINYSELYTLIRSEFGESTAILLPDNHYNLATMESFKKFLEHDNTNKYKYTGDPGFDCDDYASILQGRASIPGWATVPIGTIWCSKPAHALNLFVDENRKIWLVECQTDKVFETPDDWVPYVVWF